jgi:hypothetical protein
MGMHSGRAGKKSFLPDIGIPAFSLFYTKYNKVQYFLSFEINIIAM